jgi:hypothetical protein
MHLRPRVALSPPRRTAHAASGERPCAEPLDPNDVVLLGYDGALSTIRRHQRRRCGEGTHRP